MSEKTEQPTAKKLRDARQKGQVAKSQEVASTAVILSAFLVVWIGWDSMLANIKEMVLLPTHYMDRPFAEALPMVLAGVLSKAALVCAPVVFLAAVMGVAANYMQVGFLFSLESIKPDLKKINPGEGAKRIFCKKNFLELVKSALKILFLGILLKMVVEDALDALMKIPYGGMDGLMAVLGKVLFKIVVNTGLCFTIVAAFDFFLQKKLHTKQLMMSKDEVKREYKEMEGDPIIKSKRKQLHQELVMSDTIAKVKKSSVLVTNPTHLAVALFYEKGKTKLPVVTAKGANLVARRMVEAAKEAGVPIMQNVPLAHNLYDDANVGQYIPGDLIEPVAEVLRWVQQLQDGKV